MEENIKHNYNDDDPKRTLSFESSKPITSIITFSKMNKHFFIPFLTPIAVMLSNYFFGELEDSMKDSSLVTSLCDEVAIFVAGLLYFFTKFDKSTENKKEPLTENIKTNQSFEYIYIEKEINIDQTKLLLLLVTIAILLTVYETFDGIYSDDKVNIFGLEVYFFIYSPIFCKFILKENIYKHHYFSLFIGVIGIALVSIPVGLKLSDKDKIPNLYNFIVATSITLFFIIIKYVMTEYYISIFKIYLIVSVVSIILEFIVFIIISLSKNQDLSYFKELFEFKTNENTGNIILYFILAFIFTVISQALLALVLLYFSPLLLMVTHIISPFLNWIFSVINEGQELPDVVLYPIGYLIVVFASLIYNEIIILNFCGLNMETKKFIEQRLFNDITDLKKMELELKSQDFDSDSDNSDDY